MAQAKTLIKSLAARLDIMDGDVILIRAGSRLANQQSMNNLMTALSERGRSHCILVVVGEFTDLSTLSEGQMNVYGWYRKRPENGEGQ